MLWVTYRCHIRLLVCLRLRCFRTILNIRWSDFITNIVDLEQAEIPYTVAMLLTYQLSWAGHDSRMDGHRFPNIALYGELSTGHRDGQSQKKRYKDCPTKSNTACYVDHLCWSDMTAVRDACRHSIFKVIEFEQVIGYQQRDKRSKGKA